MMNLNSRIEALHTFGEWLQRALNNNDSYEAEALQAATLKAFHGNGWFTKDEVIRALSYWGEVLNEHHLNEWIKAYPSLTTYEGKKRVLLILAGNIPLVGMHDVVTTFLSGNKAVIKCSSSDDILLPFLFNEWTKLVPALEDHVEWVDGIQKNFDAVLATGSNNSSRHFEQYFQHVPKLIRSNRTGVAVLQGNETDEELHGLMEDAFFYFGLGCRNITKLYLPKGFHLNRLFKASMPFAYLMDNNKYANNYAYHKAIMMMERQAFLENELILLRESEQLFSPVSVLNYEYYDSVEQLNDRINSQLDQVQCVIGKENIPFGSAQKPKLNDYADGEDTLDFLVNL